MRPENAQTETIGRSAMSALSAAIMHFRRSRLARALVLVMAASVLLAPAAAAQNAQSIVVLVNDEPVSDYDVQQRMKFRAVTSGQEPTSAMRKKVIEQLVSERIQMQEAEKNGIAVDKSKVDEIIGRVAESNNMTAAQLEKTLGRGGVNIRTMRDEIEARIAWQQVIRQKFRYQVDVGDAQIDEALSKDDSASQGDEKTQFQLQRVRLDLSDQPEQKAIAARLVEGEKLRRGVSSCSDLSGAVKNLRDASVKSMGRKTADEVAQPTRAMLLAAETGRMTPPIVTSSGIELYAVCNRRSVNVNEEQRKKVRSELLQEEYSVLAERHLKDLRQDAYVEYR